jgi:hypothetical protein
VIGLELDMDSPFTPANATAWANYNEQTYAWSLSNLGETDQIDQNGFLIPSCTTTACKQHRNKAMALLVLLGLTQ